MDGELKIIAMVATPVTLTVVGWLIRHSINNERHPSAKNIEKLKDNVVFKDVCTSEMNRLGDTVAAETKRSDERHTEVKEDLKEIKELIRNNGRR